MTAAGDAFASLPRSIRTWLDAFSAAVEAIQLDDLQLLAVVPFRGGQDEARERAGELARRTSRTGAIEAIDKVALEYIARRYARLMTDGWRPFLGSTLATRTSGRERARLAASFADALTAIALSDVLEPDEVDTLLGPWAELADPEGRR
jgi:hypothetical protein